MNIAKIMSFEEFKKVLESDTVEKVACYVRISKKDAKYLFDYHSDRTNRNYSSANLNAIRNAFDNGTWDNNAGNIITFGKKEIAFNNIRQVLDGGHRIKGLSTSFNESAYMDVIVLINCEPSYFQDCGKKRTATDQVVYAEIIKVDDFSPVLNKALNIQIRAQKIEPNNFYTNIMKNHYDLVEKFEGLIDLSLSKSKNYLLRYVATLSSLFNLYCLGDLEDNDVIDIYNFFLNPEDDKYLSKTYIPLRDLNRILTNTSGGGDSKNKRLFVLATNAFIAYKTKSGKRIYNNENKKASLIDWPEFFDFAQEKLKKAQ